MAKVNNSHNLTIRESRAIIKYNIKQMKYYEGLKKRKLLPHEYQSTMIDENNIIEIDKIAETKPAYSYSLTKENFVNIVLKNISSICICCSIRLFKSAVSFPLWYSLFVSIVNTLALGYLLL